MSDKPEVIIFSLLFMFIIGMLVGEQLKDDHWESKCIEAKIGFYDEQSGEFKLIEVK